MTIDALILVLLSASGALLAGMAAIIKVMVLGKLEDIQKTMTGLSRDVHRIDLRVTKLEAEHHMNACIHGKGGSDD